MDEKDCVYCKHGEPLNDTANSNFAIVIDQEEDNRYITVEYDDSYEQDSCGAYINFCPMCGRKLAEDGEEV
ncbi:hypothetical protein FQS90_09565 [Enterococcus casseliflavus]|uniref:hypothetical protein n=1 Tax=Enterococcus sp. 8E11_MSG4843 TaxID=1834190 RepID=UPI000B3EAA06|nr:hypothetical protein [Enterococcus sp. 8E11_MSG4843]MBO1096770.1 hypothetical protein [Enterococcus casseliflavus]MBO1145092.1 hypothetical protein [Enterococcus casseliflavus]OUZ36768.1 hypothetical protein A5885_000957 [Enterococcus sp. 8E11_MSG4843]